MSAVVRIPTRGPFSLVEVATFGFGPPADGSWDDVWRLAFVLDGYAEQVGVEVRQPAAEELELTVHTATGSEPGPATVAAAARQVARIASCNHDGDAFAALSRTDPALERLVTAAAGLRPPLFASPYEGAVWAMLTQRRTRRQAGALRQRLVEQAGTAFTLAGRAAGAIPVPERLLDVHALPGLPDEQLSRLHGVARAALDGRFDVERIAASDPDEAMRDLRTIPGIGPFSAGLVVIRASGLADVLVLDEPRSRAAVAALWDRPDTLTDADYRVLAEGWRPFRTWVAVLARAAGNRVPALPHDRAVTGRPPRRPGRQAGRPPTQGALCGALATA